MWGCLAPGGQVRATVPPLHHEGFAPDRGPGAELEPEGAGVWVVMQ